MNVAINGTIYPLGGGSGGSGGPAEEIYSTEERRIGTWIDGKPIYRQTLALKSPSKVNTDVSYDFPGVDTFVSWNGYLNSTVLSEKMPINMYFTQNAYVLVYYKADQILTRVGHQNYCNMDMFITIEYTKTTD